MLNYQIIFYQNKKLLENENYFNNWAKWIGSKPVL